MYLHVIPIHVAVAYIMIMTYFRHEKKRMTKKTGCQKRKRKRKLELEASAAKCQKLDTFGEFLIRKYPSSK